MRPIWSGNISFSLVSIPIKLYSASEERKLHFQFVHKKDSSPVRYAKICQEEDKEITYDQIAKGYKIDDHFVILENQDFDEAKVESSNTIEIIIFSDQEEIDLVYYEKPYYLEPAKGGNKSYKLLFEALKQTNKVGICRFVIRNREHLSLIRPYQNILLLNQLRFKNEIRETSNIEEPKNEQVFKGELDLAKELINRLTKKFNPSEFHDTYTERLEEVIEQKESGQKPVLPHAKTQSRQVKDLMGLLKQSLKQ